MRINHWAHKSLDNCDGWLEPHTQWHEDWKRRFPIDWTDQIIERNGAVRFADVLHPETGVIIKLQQRKISEADVRLREEFFGYDKLIWLVDATDARDRISITDLEAGKIEFTWKRARQWVRLARAPIYLDIGNHVLKMHQPSRVSPLTAPGYRFPKSSFLQWFKKGGELKGRTPMNRQRIIS